MKIPLSADGYAFIYNNANPAFVLGGFIYFDAKAKIVAVNYLLDEAAATDKSHPISFGDPQPAPAEAYNAFREALNEGVPINGHQMQAAPELASRINRYAWLPPGSVEHMPHGGFAYLLKSGGWPFVSSRIGWRSSLSHENIHGQSQPTQI